MVPLPWGLKQRPVWSSVLLLKNKIAAQILSQCLPYVFLLFLQLTTWRPVLENLSVKVFFKSIPLLGISPKELKSGSRGDSSTVHDSQDIETNLNVMIDGWRTCVFIQWNTIQPWRRKFCNMWQHGWTQVTLWISWEYFSVLQWEGAEGGKEAWTEVQMSRSADTDSQPTENRSQWQESTF